MEEIRKTSVTAPVRVGDVILADVCGSNIIATKNID
jgi:CxxC motif-containing protein